MLIVARERGWDPVSAGFYRTEPQDEIKKRWEGCIVELTREWKRRFKEVGKEGTGGEAGLEIEEALDYLLGIVLEVLSRDEVPPIWIQSLEYV